jgi:hypothetical protein
VLVLVVDLALEVAVVAPPTLPLAVALPLPEVDTDVVTLEPELVAVLVPPAVCAIALFAMNIDPISTAATDFFMERPPVMRL